MNRTDDIANRTIFHFNCPLCGGTPAERRLEDFLTNLNRGELERLDRFLALIFTAIHQISHGESRWLRNGFQQCADVLLDLIRNGGEESLFPAAIHAAGYGSSLDCLIACPLCLEGPGIRKDTRGGFFVRWNEACKVQTANLCFEAALILSGLQGMDQPAQSPAGINLEQVRAELLRTAAATGLPCCPRCGRPTSCLYGPEKPYLLKGRCRWCLDSSGPAISVTLTAEHVKVMIDSTTKQGQIDSPPDV